MPRSLLLALAGALTGYAVGTVAVSRVGARIDRAINQILADG